MQTVPILKHETTSYSNCPLPVQKENGFLVLLSAPKRGHFRQFSSVPSNEEGLKTFSASNNRSEHVQGGNLLFLITVA